MIYGYVGVSTAAQDETDQVQRLKAVEVRKDIPREDHRQDGNPPAAGKADETACPRRARVDRYARSGRPSLPGISRIGAGAALLVLGVSRDVITGSDSA